MNNGYQKIWLGFFSGVLITMACGLVAVCYSFYVWSHHMFIIGLHWPSAGFVLLIPVILALGGTLCLARAFRCERV